MNRKSRGVLVVLTAFLAINAGCVLGQNSTNPTSQPEDAHKQYLALPLGNGLEKGLNENRNRYGVPFLDGALPLQPRGTAEVGVGAIRGSTFVAM